MGPSATHLLTLKNLGCLPRSGTRKGGVESWTDPQVDSSDSTYEAMRVDHGPSGGPVASGKRQPTVATHP